MLAPRARSALVCLRCEVRTARPRPAACPLTITCARFSTSTARRHDANDAETLLETPPAQIRISKEVQPLNKLRKRRGKVIRETSSGLGNRKQLGQAADILVLKEELEVSNAAPEEPVEKPKAIEPVTTPDIVASLQDDNRRLTHDEILERLESLRPKTADNPDQREHVTLTEFLKYTKLLMDSFTSAQLAAYYSATNSKTQQQQLLNDIQKSLEKEKDFTQHTIKRSQWQSGTNPIDSRLPSLIPRYSKAQRKAVHKQLLVNRILRDVWRLVLMEEVESLGQLELYLKPWQVTLLTAGEGGTVLEQIGQTRRARIELLRKESVVRITADKNTADYVTSDIEKSLSKVESKLLELKPWVPRLVEAQVPQDKNLAAMYLQSDLDAISRASHTSVEVVSTSRLLIRGMNMDAVLEAERYLMKLLPVKDSSVYTADTTMLGAAKKSAYLLPVYPGEDLVGSDLRGTQLGRWALPLGPKHGPQLEEKPEALKFSEFAKRSRNLVDHTVAAIRGPNEEKTKTRDAIGYWRDAPTSRLYAEIGQIVYPLEQTQTDKDITLAQSHSSHPGFLSKFPGLPSVLTSLDTYGDTGMLPPTLVYDFIPAPQQKRFKEHQTIPNLRIEMHTNWKHGTSARLHKLELRLQSRIHDVHLANEAADVRFCHSKSLQLKTHTEGHKAFWDQDKNVRKWTEAVIANISSGGRLSAPPLSISIPKWTVPECDPAGKASRIVDYLFTGLQFRQTIMGHYKGMPIQYSTVQSGKFGFTGGQLLAFHDDNQKPRSKSLMDEISLRNFAETCFSLVSRMTAGAAHILPVSKKLKPRHEDSERRLRRAAMQKGALADTNSNSMATTDALEEKSSHDEQTRIESPYDTGFDPEEDHSPLPTRHSVNDTDNISQVYNRAPFEFESPFSEHSSTSKPGKSDSRREEDRQPLKDMA